MSQVTFTLLLSILITVLSNATIFYEAPVDAYGFNIGEQGDTPVVTQFQSWWLPCNLVTTYIGGGKGGARGLKPPLGLLRGA